MNRSGWTDSNRRPEAWKASALPTELHPQRLCFQITTLIISLKLEMYSCLVMAPPVRLEHTTLEVETPCSNPTELRGQSLKNFYFINDTISYLFKDRVVPLAGLEPARPKARDFKSPMSTVPSQGHWCRRYQPLRRGYGFTLLYCRGHGAESHEPGQSTMKNLLGAEH